MRKVAIILNWGTIAKSLIESADLYREVAQCHVIVWRGLGS
jgi:hypothetical protein